ncbi:hypothetical protein F5B21DRAFT_230455 [Xylaria acuta]|nr:hypothetical protein F5B21DRAFT_230455 [Xylaria acuta]
MVRFNHRLQNISTCPTLSPIGTKVGQGSLGRETAAKQASQKDPGRDAVALRLYRFLLELTSSALSLLFFLSCSIWYFWVSPLISALSTQPPEVFFCMTWIGLFLNSVFGSWSNFRMSKRRY